MSCMSTDFIQVHTTTQIFRCLIPAPKLFCVGKNPLALVCSLVQCGRFYTIQQTICDQSNDNIYINKSLSLFLKWQQQKEKIEFGFGILHSEFTLYLNNESELVY